MVKPIDNVTWRRVRVLREGARVLGRDLVEVFNDHGLLLTPDRVKAIKAVALRDAARQLENATAAQVISDYGGSNNTALDMQRGVVAWLRARADREEDGGR
ncbi:MAG TPA: hypothetical protein VFQ06_15545 [Nitrospira sp.]|nr:hypothetical protein [Nitrospira sp.]